MQTQSLLEMFPLGNLLTDGAEPKHECSKLCGEEFSTVPIKRDIEWVHREGSDLPIHSLPVHWIDLVE